MNRPRTNTSDKPLPDFAIGDRVKSRRVGNKPAFSGTVLERVVNGWGDPFFHVQEDGGSLWHRDQEDLEAAQ